MHSDEPAPDDFPAGQLVHEELPTPTPATYEAAKPEEVDDPSDLNRTCIYPVTDITGPGSAEPEKGLPDNAVVDEQDDVSHENTDTLSQHDSVLKLVNVRVTVAPGDDAILI